MAVVSATAAPATRSDVPLVLIVWIGFAILFLGRALLVGSALPLLGDADDAMRMVGAVDLLNGQGWQDHMQYRDNTPYGASMHWSRLVDAPIAALIAIATPFAGASAPRVAAMLWPLILMLPMLALSLALVRRLVPDADAVTPLALPVISLVLLIEFIPGRVDHHNVQILLCLVMALCLIAGRERLAGGIIAGLAGATSLAIGMETLPLLAVVTTIFVLLWVADPSRYRLPLAGYGAALGLGTLAHFFIATAPQEYFGTACDALSVVYVLPALAGGFALFGGALLATSLPARWQRLAVMLGLGAIVAGTAAALFPHCLKGPYAGVTELMPHYFDDIAEAQPLWVRLSGDPSTSIAFAFSILLTIPITFARVRAERGARRLDWAIILALLAVASAVMVFQIRGARIAAPFALPAAAWLVTVVRQRYLAQGGTLNALRLVATWLLFAGVAHYAIIITAVAPASASARGPLSVETVGGARLSCVHEAAYAKLAALPKGRVILPFRLGPHVMASTPHAVVGSGFHRNTRGMLDTEAFFAGDEATARRIAEERGIDYVVLCPSVPEYDLPVGPALGQQWAWLTPLSAPGDVLQIYRVTR